MPAPAPSGAAEPNEGRPIASLLSCDRPAIPPRCVSVADNSWHFVVIDPSVPTDLANSVRRAMSDVYGPTTLFLAEQSEVNDLTDVIVYATDHGENGAAGWTYCPPDAQQGMNEQGHRWCRQQELHFNLNARYGVFFADEASRNHLACHELGHTIGLRHWGNPPTSEGPVAATCMNSDTPNGPVDLHEFDRENINAYYPAPPEPSRRCLSVF